jgi:zinc transporter ZupT
MWMNEVLAALVLMLSGAIGVIHYVVSRYSESTEKYHYQLLSLNGGLFMALVFLILLPEAIEFSHTVNVYLLMLLGFVIFNIMGKALSQYVKDKEKAAGEVRLLHEAGIFLDHFMLGFVLVTSVELEPTLGFLVAIPIALHTISSAFSLPHIHESGKTGPHKPVLSLSTPVGAIAALLLSIEHEIQGGILALLLGMLLYIGIRDFVPRGDKGYPLLFLGGVGIVVLVWIFFGR